MCIITEKVNDWVKGSHTYVWYPVTADTHKRWETWHYINTEFMSDVKTHPTHITEIR